INIIPCVADVSVVVDDTIRWKYYVFEEYNEDIIMTITNVSSKDGVLVVEGNIKYSDGTIIDQGDLIWYNGFTLNISGQASLLGIGGIV
ncbi:MAG: hypothetical protein ACFFG0_57185, partial [Candidatus Thorarchaeota archaeon]